MTPLRKAFVITVDLDGPRARFARDVLSTVGFEVLLTRAVHDPDPVLSLKRTNMQLWEHIATHCAENEWMYIFEDDVNMLDKLTIAQLVPYERHAESAGMFFLGCCLRGWGGVIDTPTLIDGHPVVHVRGHVRGAHAIGYSRTGARAILALAQTPEQTRERHVDIITEAFTTTVVGGVPVVRFDLHSDVDGHNGIVFQDRRRFPHSYLIANY